MFGIFAKEGEVEAISINGNTVYQLKRKELGLSGEKASELLEAATGTNWTD